LVSSAVQEPQLEPRYRRVLSFGDVLDESVGLFRRRWAFFALVSAVWLIPPGLLTVLVTAGGAFATGSLVGQIETGVTPDLSRVSTLVAGIALIYVVSALFLLGWTAAVVVTADEYLHAIKPSLGNVLVRTLRRYPPTLLSGLVYGLAMVLLIAVATGIGALFVLAFPVSLIVSWRPSPAASCGPFSGARDPCGSSG